MRPLPLLLLPVLSLAATAQNNSAKSATGTVTGHVYCADTNAPARMVGVQLKPVKNAETRSGAHPHSTSNEPANGVIQTTLDGSFAIPNVSPGSYYIIITASGYLSPGPQDEDTKDARPQPSAEQPPIVIPKVDVEADQTASIDVKIERGAAVSGNIRFDDGSPATNVLVVLLRKSKDKWVPLPTGDYGAFAMPSSMMTDDLGHYRTGGLRSGEYLLMATLIHVDLAPPSAHGSGEPGTIRSVLPIYSGDTARKSEAVPFKLGPGEDRAGVDITIPLSKLHSVSGVVTAASNGHVINSGHITIEDPVDKESVADGMLDSDGIFRLDGVPEGSYTLRIHDASDKQNRQVSVAGGTKMDSEKTVHQYGDLEQSLKIEGDIPNLVLSVPEQTKEHAAASQ
jgi:hypothetical protein